MQAPVRKKSISNKTDDGKIVRPKWFCIVFQHFFWLVKQLGKIKQRACSNGLTWTQTYKVIKK